MIRQPIIYLYVGIIAGVDWLFIALLYLFGPASIFDFTEYIQRIAVSCPFLCLDIAMWFFVSFQLNWKIEIKKDGFTFTNTFKKEKTYKFDEIEERQLRACYRYYHNGKHIVCISMLLDDFYMLSEAIAAYRAKKKKEGEIQ